LVEQEGRAAFKTALLEILERGVLWVLAQLLGATLFPAVRGVREARLVMEVLEVRLEVMETLHSVLRLREVLGVAQRRDTVLLHRGETAEVEVEVAVQAL
jgi:hypothetical protein